MHKIKTQKTTVSIVCVLLTLLGMLFGIPQNLYAVSTTPATINYQGRLLNSANTPLNGNYTFRFSLWNSADWVAGDTTPGGAIDITSPSYSGWQEAHAVTTANFGLFNISLGSLAALPNFTAGTHDFLQVEVKVTGALDTTYEILDPQGTTADLIDRKTIHDQAYAENADTIDNVEIGTGAGNIPVLGVGGIWNISTMPDGTNADFFQIDADNNAVAGIVHLNFGSTLLNHSLSYDPNGVGVGDGWFDFNDDVNIAGNLTTTGTINGVNLSSIPFGNLATRAKTEVFEPEYNGYSLEADGINNSGKMLLDFTDGGGTAKRNFYEWTTQKVALQDMDIVISYQLPLDFVSFTAAPLSVNYQTSNGVAATNKIDVSLEDSTGTAVALAGGSSLANAAWTTAAITFGGAPTFTAGTTITLHLKLSSDNTGWARVSEVILNYNGR